MKKTVLLVQGSGQLAARNPKVFQEMKQVHGEFLEKLVVANEVAVIQFSERIDKTFDFTSDFKELLSTFDHSPSEGGSQIDVAVDKALDMLKGEDEKVIYVTGGHLHRPSFLKAAVDACKKEKADLIFLKDFALPPFLETKYGFPITIL